MTNTLNAEDYFENLNFSDTFKISQPKRIPMERIMEKLFEHFSFNDYASAERHLKYWLQEAISCKDDAGALSLYNELMGIYRKTNRQEEAIDSVKKALELSKKAEFDNSIILGTTYLNIGTVLKAFGKSTEAVNYYEKALCIYKNNLDDNNTRFAGLYNNFALALVDINQFDKARSMYMKAIDIISKSDNGELDCAISYLNLANLEEAEFGLIDSESKINDLLDKAKFLLDSKSNEKSGYYAFVCEKCAPTYSYYGFFIYAAELSKRARDIYERT